MKIKGNPFFSIKDLQHLELSIEGTNATSQVKILKSAIQLTEIHPDGIGIEVPPKSCAIGHSLSLHIHAKQMTGTIQVTKPDGTVVEEPQYIENQMQMTGTVEKLEVVENQRLQVHLRFRQFAKQQWDTLLDYFSSKQGTVNHLIKISRK